MSTPLELARRIVGAVNFMDNPLMPDAKILAQALIEAAKDTERLDWLAEERLYYDAVLGWIPSVYPIGWRLHGKSLRDGIDAAKEKA